MVTRVDAAGSLSVCAYGLLLALSRGQQNLHLLAFFGIMFAAWAALGFACTSKERIPTGKIWFWAIAFRIAGFLGQPVLEDDWYRYLWDGAVFATTGNPYEKAPSLFFADPSVSPRLQPMLDGINHPDVPTIYGPVCQAIFLVSYWIAPGKLWPLKLMVIAGDLAAIALMGRMVSGKRLLLYAWCPLLIKEASFTAHPDIVGIALLLGALSVQRPRTVAILCALAVGTKAFALLIAVLLLLRLPKRNWITFLALLAGLYFPFWIQGSLADWSALRTFASDWEFNSTIYGVIGIWTNARTAKLICATIFLVIYAAYSWRLMRVIDPRSVPRGDWIYGAFFLLSAVVNPWYLLWMLPFVSLFPTAAGIAALIIVSAAYAHGLNLPGSELGPYDHPVWVRVAEVVTVFLAGTLPYLLRHYTPQTRG